MVTESRTIKKEINKELMDEIISVMIIRKPLLRLLKLLNLFTKCCTIKVVLSYHLFAWIFYL